MSTSYIFLLQTGTSKSKPYKEAASLCCLRRETGRGTVQGKAKKRIERNKKEGWDYCDEESSAAGLGGMYI